MRGRVTRVAVRPSQGRTRSPAQLQFRWGPSGSVPGSATSVVPRIRCSVRIAQQQIQGSIAYGHPLGYLPVTTAHGNRLGTGDRAVTRDESSLVLSALRFAQTTLQPDLLTSSRVCGLVVACPRRKQQILPFDSTHCSAATKQKAGRNKPWR